MVDQQGDQIVGVVVCIPVTNVECWPRQFWQVFFAPTPNVSSFLSIARREGWIIHAVSVNPRRKAAWISRAIHNRRFEVASQASSDSVLVSTRPAAMQAATGGRTGYGIGTSCAT